MTGEGETVTINVIIGLEIEKNILTHLGNVYN